MLHQAFFVALFIGIQLTSGYCSAQQQLPIIDSASFDKTITQQVTYAITGENVPTGGVKVDLTKAIGTVTGYIATRKGMDYSLDLSLGITEGTASLFSSHTNLHSDFNATFNFIWIPWKSSASMDPLPANMIRKNFASYKTNSLLNKRDSLLCVVLVVIGHRLTTIGPNREEVQFNAQEFAHEMVENSEQLHEEWQRRGVRLKIDSLIDKANSINRNNLIDTTQLTRQQQKLIRELVKRYFGDVIRTNRLPRMYTELDTIISPTVAVRRDLLLNDFIACVNRFINMEEDNLNYQIKLASPYWNVKKLYWTTFSPFVKRQGFSLFDQTISQRTDTSSVTYGIGVRANWLCDWKNSLLYIRGGLDFFRANNLSDFKKVEYIERDSITTAGSKNIYSEKKGVSYTGDKLDHEFGWNLSIECYFFWSRMNFFPGLYGRFDYTSSKVYEKKYIPVLEFGLPFNINSPDKTKSVVSIAPYVRFENLNAVDKPEVDNEIKKNDFLLGIRVGLPINVMSR